MARASKAVAEVNPASPPKLERLRLARALIGWMPADDAEAALKFGRENEGTDRDWASRAHRAKLVAGTRKAGFDQATTVGNPPTGIGDYLSLFRQNAQNLFDEGWRVCLVDVGNLYALQPITFTDHYEDRVRDATSYNMRALAEITLPLATEMTQTIQYDAQQRAWIVSSDNPHLRLAGQADSPSPPAGHGFGFVVGGSNSVLKVAHFEGRYFCHDGHHRCYQLIRRGVRSAPGLVREFGSFDEVAPNPGLLPKNLCMGERPPTIADFLDDAVSANVLRPATRKVIVISAVESIIPL